MSNAASRAGGHPAEATPLEILERQRSHLLLVLANACEQRDAALADWYRGDYRQAISAIPSVLGVQLYERHPVDVTLGQFPRFPFRYLGMVELSLDGAPAAESIIDRITTLHREQAAAELPATWLYYPSSEKVGRAGRTHPCLLTVAFANGLPDREAEFREWYATRHIRHALNIPALVSGQCFERTQFQKPGISEARFSTLAVYEQEATPEAMIASFGSVPDELFAFPSSDWSRFAESVFQPV